MEHLVESHHGGYYVSSLDPKIITEHCEQCGDSDSIVLSWEEGKRQEKLLDYFSRIKITSDEFRVSKENGMLKEEFIDSLMWYYDMDRSFINELLEDNIITREEQLKLLKQVSISQKKQFEILKSVYYSNGFVRVKKKRKK